MSRSTSPKRRRRKPLHHDRPVCPQSGRKIKYGSRKLALSAMNDLIAKQKRGRPGLRTAPNGVYRCGHCGDWHMTSKAAA